MTNLEELGWIESYKLGLSLYEQSEQLSDHISPLHDVLMTGSGSAELMDHITEALSYSWRVQDSCDRGRGGWSNLRTFEALAPNDGPILATMLAYEDSHGGIWIELLINTDIRGELTKALDGFLEKRAPNTSTVTYHPFKTH